MTRSQRITITVLSFIALILVVFIGVYAYQSLRTVAQTPLGPVLPFIPTKGLPPTWTPSPGPAPTQLGAVTLAPTLPLPTSPSGPLCGGPMLMNVLVIGADTRGDNYT